MWPDLAKFHHFGEILSIFGHSLRAKIAFGNILNLFWPIVYVWAECLLLQTAEYWTYNQAIWSHWGRDQREGFLIDSIETEQQRQQRQRSNRLVIDYSLIGQGPFP